MISLSDEYERRVRDEVLDMYQGRIGGLSIFFEKLVREYFEDSTPKKRNTAKSAKARTET